MKENNRARETTVEQPEAGPNTEAKQEAEKVCIACGAKQNADGTLPCGHDYDL